MPFLARQDAFILTASASFHAGAPTLLTQDAQIAEEGWDSLTLAYAIRRPSLTPEELIALFPHGAQLGPADWFDLSYPAPVTTTPALPGTRNFWVVSARPSLLAAGVWKAEISLKGIAGPRGYKIKLGATTKEQKTGSNVRVLHSGYGTDFVWDESTGGWVEVARPNPVPKVASTLSEPTVTISYLSANIGYERLGLVGTSLTPPIPGLPPIADPWSALADYVYNWPNGWILTASEQDRLIGCNAALITDSYKFTREKSFA